MKKNHLLLILTLTLLMLGATVLFVRAERQPQQTATTQLDETAQNRTAIAAQQTVEGLQTAYATDQNLANQEITPTPTPDQAGVDFAYPPDMHDDVLTPSDADFGYPFETGVQPPRATATITPAVGVSPTRTSISPSLSTPTHTPTRTPTSPPSINTPTATPQTGWSGDWTVWFEQANGTYRTGEITISVNGDQFTAEGQIGGSQYSFEGYLTTVDVAEGWWETSSSSGYFRWQTFGKSQFSGSREHLFGFCGARPGLTKPDPCKILPAS